MRHTVRSWINRYSFYLGGDQPSVSWAERLRACVGSLIGLLLVLSFAKFLGKLSGIDEWLIASLGASALLVFALPSSPMAQPWAVIAGNTLSALVGISVTIVIQNPLVAMPIAASLAILGMFILRCLHPPAAAVALIAALGNVMHYRYAFFPVMIDSILLVIVGAIYSNLTGKSYPNRPQ